MLTENEWNTINNMLLELYTIDELDVFTSKIMKMIRMLIPYTKGWFIILDDDRKIRKEQSYFIGFDNDVKDRYTDAFFTVRIIFNIYTTLFRKRVFTGIRVFLKVMFVKKRIFYIKFFKVPRTLYSGAVSF